MSETGVWYNGDHKVNFGLLLTDEKTKEIDENLTIKNSWDDWHLIPAEVPFVTPPAIKTSTVDIPGRHGLVDLMTIISDHPVYENRTGSIEFIMPPGYTASDEFYFGGNVWDPKRIHERVHEIASFLNKSNMVYLSLEDEDLGELKYWYEGSVWISDFIHDEDYSTITIDYDVYPFKHLAPVALRTVPGSSVPVLWSPYEARAYTIPSSSGENFVRVDNLGLSDDIVLPNIVVSNKPDDVDLLIQIEHYSKPMSGGVKLVNGLNVLFDLPYGGFKKYEKMTDTTLENGHGYVISASKKPSSTINIQFLLHQGWL